MNTCVARARVVLIGCSCWCSRMGETCLFENNSIFFQRLNAGWLCFWDKQLFFGQGNHFYDAGGGEDDDGGEDVPAVE